MLKNPVFKNEVQNREAPQLKKGKPMNLFQEIPFVPSFFPHPGVPETHFLVFHARTAQERFFRSPRNPLFQPGSSITRIEPRYSYYM